MKSTQNGLASRFFHLSIYQLVLCLSLSLSSCSQDRIRVAIFHTNDIHGWIMARDAGKLDARHPKRQLGGFAALAAAVRSHHGPYLLLDDGDWFSGTPEGGMTGGRAPIELMNLLGYDATEVGNHDFDYGEATLKDLVGRAKMPVLGANVYDEKTGKRVPYLKPHILKEIAGVRFGIFGLLTTTMPSLTFSKNYKGLFFRREADEARDQVAALKKEGADIIIALTHVGFRRTGTAPFDDDQVIASEVPGIDLIIGGHSHTALYKPVREPTNGTWIVQAGSYLQYVGQVDLAIDPGTKKIVHLFERLMPLWVDRFGEDPAVLGAVKDSQARVGKELDVVIGRAAAPLRRSQAEESAIGDWMTDCMRDWAHADVAFQNSGGIRDDIAEGPVTLREIYEVMPFDNVMVTMRIQGRYLKGVLENGVAGGHGLMQISGLRVVYDPKAAAGRRIVEAKIGGKPLDPERFYTAVATDFLTAGGDGYTAFSKAVKSEKKATLLRDVLAQCVRKSAEIAPLRPGRLEARQ
jgi:5'-nucleotidase/UDP-sugar diphosphatase